MQPTTTKNGTINGNGGGTKTSTSQRENVKTAATGSFTNDDTCAEQQDDDADDDDTGSNKENMNGDDTPHAPSPPIEGVSQGKKAVFLRFSKYLVKYL